MVFVLWDVRQGHRVPIAQLPRASPTLHVDRDNSCNGTLEHLDAEVTCTALETTQVCFGVFAIAQHHS